MSAAPIVPSCPAEWLDQIFDLVSRQTLEDIIEWSEAPSLLSERARAILQQRDAAERRERAGEPVQLALPFEGEDR